MSNENIIKYKEFLYEMVKYQFMDKSAIRFFKVTGYYH